MSLFAGMLPPVITLREADPRTYSADLAQLAPPEAAMMHRAVDKRRREFTAGRMLAREAISVCGVDDLVLVNDEDRVPIWPEGFTGSITHTHTWCAVAVARAGDVRGVGLDVERAEPLKENLWDTICTPRDLAWLASQPEPERGSLGKAIFSAKEAAYKAQYAVTQQYLGFQAMSIELNVKDGTWRATFEQASGQAFRPGDVLDGTLRRTSTLIATALILR